MPLSSTTASGSKPEHPPIEEACYWLAKAGRSPEPSSVLAGATRAEIAIIGAGFTGLWTAIHLKAARPELDVAIVEQERCGYGASGRNAGMVGDNIDDSHAMAIRHFGLSEAKRIAQVGRANFEEMLGWLERRGIACDLERNGMLTFALHPSHMESVVEEMEAARELGIDDLRMLDGAAARDELRSDMYVGALFNPAGATVDPIKLVDGLRREAIASGVRLYEQSPIVSIDASAAGAPIRVRSKTGELRCETLVLAMGAYTHHLLSRVLLHFMPLHDYVVVSEPLSAEQRAAIGWQNRQSAIDARTFFKYFRLTSDDRILWGNADAQYHAGNRVDRSCDHSERHFEGLRTSFVEQFPALSKLRFPYAWGGAICTTTRLTPFFGSAYDGRVHYALGYTGHGLATTHLAGKVLAHRALRRTSAFDELRIVRDKPVPFPPEPFRGWAVDVISRDLRRADNGERRSMLLQILDAFGVGFSS